jgi:L-histidine N-alpha-methyltransferase
VVFLGSSIGNFSEAEERRFWKAVAREMPAGSFFLLGVDLVKDPELLNAAYNDAAGVTAAFTRNLFVRMNRELGSGLDTRAIRHQARYVPERQRVEIHARFERAQTLSVQPLRRRFRIADGEPVLLEISRKYQLPELTERLAGHGFTVRRIFTDERDWFALVLLQRSGPAGRHGR